MTSPDYIDKNLSRFLDEIEAAKQLSDEKATVELIKLFEHHAKINHSPTLCRFLREYCLNFWRETDLRRLGYTNVRFFNRPRIEHSAEAVKDACGWDARVTHSKGYDVTVQFKASFDPSFPTVTFEERDLTFPSFRYLLHYKVRDGKPEVGHWLDWTVVQERLWEDYKRGNFSKYVQMGAEENERGLLHMRRSPDGKPFFFVDSDALMGAFVGHVERWIFKNNL
ncbi:MAG: hypothetical protein Q8K86_07100 [Candidatus Nanopelagicaceae bacterium]|nr:hypothetical protein [Candidatus Nanopelagicaceae bacterium]